jgi:hypothetical protein
MLRVVTDTKEASEAVARLEGIVKTGAFDQPVEIAAFRVHRELVEKTPKRWTGLTRREWQIQKTGPGERLVFNRSKVMLFLEGGTGNAGTPTSNGGYIYPKTKKFLFVPMRQEAQFGWKPGMRYGTDYILKRRVRGIKAMRIVEKMRPRAAEILKGEMKNFLERIFK